MRSRPTLILLASATLVLSGCAGPTASERSAQPAIVTVPGDHPTISDAVAAAAEGDTVLVASGAYRETVTIDTPGITLRGEDRNGVVIDGEVRRGSGVVVSAPRVTVANLTVRNATQNGVLVTGMRDDDGEAVGGHDGYSAPDPNGTPLLDGFLVDHVTASNNGLYGIYAFHSSNGAITDSFASGGADSGIYVGQCASCNIVVSGNVAERNAVGFEVANAGGDLVVTGNRFVGNRVGATITSDYQEAFVPQRGATLAGNVIAANAQHDTPEQADGGFGIGIGIAGGTENHLIANLITGHPVAGLVVTSAEDLGPIGNRTVGNAFDRNSADVVYAPTPRGAGSGNCWEGNTLAGTVPEGLQSTSPCSAPAEVAAGSIARVQAPAGIPFTDVVAPPPQPDLGPVDAAATPWRGEAAVPDVDLDAVAIPAPTLLAERSAISW
ncbi:nitrous oxide reductase family maturation protein NosD [Microbacterium sp. 179-I 3D3 NHS]|uniref:right-handed parallel beta-helix repeat-containing protein n=1 Tax=Microbacterium sp. 179-I 3D3 NHS TaxID=3142382 RepID=UPI0039A2E376